MSASPSTRIRRSFASIKKWYASTPERALDQAYEAAMAIQAIEDEHFNGQAVPLKRQNQGAMALYFQSGIQQYLRTIRRRLNEFKVSTYFVEISLLPSHSPLSSRQSDRYKAYFKPQPKSDTTYPSESDLESQAATTILDKLRVIDTVLAKYQPVSSPPPNPPPNGGSPKVSDRSARPSPQRQHRPDPKTERSQEPVLQKVQDSLYEAEFTSDDISVDPTKLDSASFIPRSILRTVTRVRKELNPDPNMEDQILNDFRSSRLRTRAAVRFVLLLMVLPLLTQQITKNFVVGPVVDHIKGSEKLEIIINPEVENRVLDELSLFEERLKFQSLTSPEPFSNSEIQNKLRDRAAELSEEYQWQLTAPIKNIFADFISLIVFALLIVFGQKEIAILKSFFDEVIYGLSDSAKAFIIILFTDVFVGFHSPHGWEVIVESLLFHFGLPLNHSFINMFIATFPVMLDTVFKYWIFRYLNQISPSAVATYRNMNE